MGINVGGSQSSFESGKAPKQYEVPTKVDLERENDSKIIQLLAGDCHVIVKDQESMYAWGQGSIIEDNQIQDVICNQPVVL